MQHRSIAIAFFTSLAFSTISARAQSDIYRYEKGLERVEILLSLKNLSATKTIPVTVDGRRVDTRIEVFSDPTRSETAPRRIRFVEPESLAGKDYWIYPRWLEHGVKEPVQNPENVRKKLDEILKPATVPCQPAEVPPFRENSGAAERANPPSSEPLVRGMDKAINLFYRTCAASGIVLKTPYKKQSGNVDVVGVRSGSDSRKIRSVKSGDEAAKRYVANHPVLMELSQIRARSDAQAQACIDQVADPVKGRLPLYGWGAKSTINKSSGKISITHNQGPIALSGVGTNREYASVDCSTLVGSAMVLAGLKLTSDQVEDFPRTMGTWTFQDSIPPNNKKSCFEETHFKNGSELRAGDVISSAGLHVVMVDSVGRDPFHLGQASTREACEEAAHSPENWDFVISQSASIEHVGVHKVAAKVYFSAPETRLGSYFTNIAGWIKSMCIRKLDGKETVGTAPGGQFTKHPLSIVRHKGKVAGCTAEPKTFEGEECIEGCHKI